MSAIFDNASSITLGHKLSLTQTSSQSGKRSAQRRGPYLYTFEVELNDMSTSSEKYHDVTSEIRSLNYGVELLYTRLHSVHTASRGSWIGSPKIIGANQTGSSLEIGGFNASQTSVIKDGDYLTINGDSKVYQAVGEYDSDSSGYAVRAGTSTREFSINSPLVVSPANNAAITHGELVVFKLALMEYSDPTVSPRRDVDSVASWSGFKFEEVI